MGVTLYQFWTFDRKHRHGFLLNPGEGDDFAGYAAGFRFSPDGQWLVRMQKLGAGYGTLFLYRRHGYHFQAAAPGDWLGLFLHDADFEGDAMGPDPDCSHAFVALVKGMEENYAWMGVLARQPLRRDQLSFDMRAKSGPMDRRLALRL